MATKPTPGASDGTWGTELNAFLDVSLASDGKIKTEALQTDATAPVADAAVANKKYVDDEITDNTTMVPAITGAGAGYAGEESVTLPNGLVMKMGYIARSGAETAVVFGGVGTENPFATAIVSVLATSYDAGKAAVDYEHTLNTVSVNGFTIHQSLSSVDGFYWIAIGY